MKLTPWYLAALSPFAVLGFSGPGPTGGMGGQIAVLLVVFGIFFGTLSLGKIAAPKAGVEVEDQR